MYKQTKFTCDHCGMPIPITREMSTQNRNHCPHCLWSKHVDIEPGDRKSKCKQPMEPIGLTFKKVAPDKYGKQRFGELMIIHECVVDKEIVINRLAADDNEEMIMELFRTSQNLGKEVKEKLKLEGIDLIDQSDEEELKIQLFGKN